MKWLAIAFALFLTVPAFAQTKDGPSTPMTPTPDDRAKQWLILLDDQNYADAYGQMGAVVRDKAGSDDWTRKVSALRAPLGAMSARNLKDVKLTKTVPGLHNGQYAVVRYDSTFAHKAAAVETVTLVSEKGAWAVVSYSVN
ncbi:MAG TPA: DUF4019 domain-containing protein [Rhizomicrobium sp.]|jgi:hypothetical protein|nr:DUF4019 domain-containing protein [Rhizomicrobium sp.]